jgi:hypothetical protein
MHYGLAFFPDIVSDGLFLIYHTLPDTLHNAQGATCQPTSSLQPYLGLTLPYGKECHHSICLKLYQVASSCVPLGKLESRCAKLCQVVSTCIQLCQKEQKGANRSAKRS